MCLIFFAYESHPSYRLILAANRDEFFHRPAQTAHFWDSHPWVLAGRDLEMLGTWMGITKSGRFAALTNFRDPAFLRKNAKSRGFLVRDFLCSDDPVDKYMMNVKKNQNLYNPFNLLVGDASNLLYFSNHSSEVQVLKPGIFGLSNHLLDTPWAKVRKSKQALMNYLKKATLVEPQALFEILSDTEPAEDHELPSTGIGKEREKLLSPIFIQGNEYGTRASTVLLIDHNNHVFFQEKGFKPGQEHYSETVFEFDIPSPF